jgi:hypothetical protein
MKALCAFAILASLLPLQQAFAADPVYRDPQGRFTLSLPASWIPAQDENGVRFTRGRAYIAVLALKAQGSAQALLSSVGQSVSAQWKDFQIFDSEAATFGGAQGVFTTAVGINPAGYRAFLAFYAVESGNTGYVMLQSGPVEEMKNVDAEMDRIAQSFTLLARSPGLVSRGSSGPMKANAGAAPAGKPVPSAPVSSSASAATGDRYEAPDGSISFRLPPGWRARETTIGTTPVQVIEPGGGGEERLIVAVTPTTATSIQQLAQEAATIVTQQLIPGARLSANPRFSEMNGVPVSELSYSAITQGGPVVAWQAAMLRGRQAVGVLGLAREAQAALIEQYGRAVFQSIQISQSRNSAQQSAQPNSQLAQLIVGHWTWYQGTKTAGGGLAASNSREIWFYPNGRYQYTYATYVPNMPSDIDPVKTITGSYRVQGNTIAAQADSGEQATFTIEVVEGGKALRINGEIYIRE